MFFYCHEKFYYLSSCELLYSFCLHIIQQNIVTYNYIRELEALPKILFHLVWCTVS